MNTAEDFYMSAEGKIRRCNTEATNNSFRCGHNFFSDMSPEDMQTFMKTIKPAGTEYDEKNRPL